MEPGSFANDAWGACGVAGRGFCLGRKEALLFEKEAKTFAQ